MNSLDQSSFDGAVAHIQAQEKEFQNQRNIAVNNANVLAVNPVGQKYKTWGQDKNSRKAAKVIEETIFTAVNAMKKIADDIQAHANNAKSILARNPQAQVALDDSAVAVMKQYVAALGTVKTHGTVHEQVGLARQVRDSHNKMAVAANLGAMLVVRQLQAAVQQQAKLQANVQAPVAPSPAQQAATQRLQLAQNEIAQLTKRINEQADAAEKLLAAKKEEAAKLGIQ